MAAGNWIMYDNAKKLLCNGGIDFDTDTIKIALVTSSYTPSLTHTQWSDASANELSTANGYTAGGVTMTTTVTNSTSTTKLSASNDATWTASGAGITARYALMRKVGTVGALTDPVIGWCLLDTAPANVTASSGSALVITTPTGGFFDLTGATS